MKLIQADQKRFRFEMNPGEKQGLTRILKLYPLVPVAHHRLSKGHPIPHQEEGEQMLAEALKSQREENRQQVGGWLNESRRFVECAGGYQVGLTGVKSNGCCQCSMMFGWGSGLRWDRRKNEQKPAND
jgi:hypothetical protein